MLFIRQGSVRHIGRSVNIWSDIVAMFYSVSASNNGASAEVYNFGAPLLMYLPHMNQIIATMLSPSAV